MHVLRRFIFVEATYLTTYDLKEILIYQRNKCKLSSSLFILITRFNKFFFSPKGGSGVPLFHSTIVVSDRTVIIKLHGSLSLPLTDWSLCFCDEAAFLWRWQSPAPLPPRLPPQPVGWRDQSLLLCVKRSSSCSAGYRRDRDSLCVRNSSHHDALTALSAP